MRSLVGLLCVFRQWQRRATFLELTVLMKLTVQGIVTTAFSFASSIDWYISRGQAWSAACTSTFSVFRPDNLCALHLVIQCQKKHTEIESKYNVLYTTEWATCGSVSYSLHMLHANLSLMYMGPEATHKPPRYSGSSPQCFQVVPDARRPPWSFARFSRTQQNHLHMLLKSPAVLAVHSGCYIINH